MTGRAYTYVSRELFVESRTRAHIRAILRQALAELGGEVTRVRYHVNPFERHGDIAAPVATPTTYVVLAVGQY